MFLFGFFCIYILLVFVMRSVLLWEKTGINPITFKKKDDAHGFNGKVFAIISIIELIVIMINAFQNSFYKFLLPFWYMENSTLKTIGWILLCLSLIMVWIAQGQMSNSWRIGIDDKNKTSLVTKGLFSVSRNPIFLGILLANIGVFFIIPNAFTLMIISLSIVTTNTQIRLEEEFLSKVFKHEYSKYAIKVRRWL